MRRLYYFPLFAVCLFCVAMIGGCPNNEVAGQFTIVKGTVLNRRTGKPLPGVRVAVVSAPNSLLYYDAVVDSVLADARGQYALSFTNKKGLFYAVNCGGLDTYWNNRPLYLDFPDTIINGTRGSSPRLRATIDLTLGRENTITFRPSPQRVWQVQVTTLTTRFQNLYFSVPSSYFHSSLGLADNQRRTVFLYQAVPFVSTGPQYFYQTVSPSPVAHFTRTLATGTSQDTTVQLTPTAALTGDTVRATLKFGR
ncbi:MAG: hypothetical protein ACRYFX_14790 [Janthinobacterium lividum]